ncbi:hypothetical protein [Streptosporangium amethystogenes]|uniref:hypothetical protein n=1 Tax=Streptosporangium amethystogenes TaxID=2002 RepID=UPI0004C77C18|nr:hypothetical protein [Streptosporangium amethystogenes]
MNTAEITRVTPHDGLRILIEEEHAVSVAGARLSAWAGSMSRAWTSSSMVSFLSSGENPRR